MENSKKIYLIRHAESESNAGGIFEHNRLVKLTEKGKQQAKDLVEILEKDFPKADRVIVSKFVRTQETIEPYLQKNYDIETHFWLDTHEFDYLDKKPFLNKTREEFEKFSKQYWINADPFVRNLENGETFKEFIDRVDKTILKFGDLDKVNYIITHGHFIAIFGLLTKLFTAKTFEIDKQKTDFYKNLMITMGNAYETKNFLKAKNTEIIDVTDLVEKYCE